MNPGTGVQSVWLHLHNPQVRTREVVPTPGMDDKTPVIAFPPGVLWAESEGTRHLITQTKTIGNRGVTKVNLKHDWDRIDSETRKWLLNNPGCLILPRTMSTRISSELDGDTDLDQHGQIVLSKEDHDFVRDKAEAAGTIHAPAREYRFFDSTPLP